MTTIKEIKTFFRGCVSQHILQPLAQMPNRLVSGSMMQSNTICLTVCAVGSLAAYQLMHWKEWAKKEKMVDDLLNAECGLATDHLEDGATHLSNDQLVFGTQEECVNMQTIDSRGVARVDLSRVDVKLHRKVRKGKSMRYMNCVIAECKAKFGTPKRDTSNVKAVMRYATSIMQSHGLRPSHVRDYVGMIVSMVFVPTKSELEGLQLLNSGAAVSRKMEYLIETTLSGLTQAN